MIWIIVTYLIGMLIVFLVLNFKNRSREIECLKLDKYGLIFASTKRHKLYVGDVKMLVVENNVYLKKQGKTIVIKNVCDANLKKGWIYFSSLGKVRIVFNAKKFYKYFAVRVQSESFSLNAQKHKAMHDILNNLFEIDRCKELKRYLFIMQKILKIDLETGVKVSKNNYNLKFSLLYKFRGQLKKVNIL